MNANSVPPKPPTNLSSSEIQARIDSTGEPLAYVEGFAYFYGRRFIVTPDVLIPRPETENIINLALAHCLARNFANCDDESDSCRVQVDSMQVLDLCTGSGCVGITLKLENPQLDVTCSDISEQALEVARQNAEQLQAVVKFTTSDLFSNLPGRYDLIVTNPPYVDKDWPWLDQKSLDHEPSLALYAEEHGLQLIKKILESAPDHLKTNGLLLLECDPSQHQAVINYAATQSLTHITTRGFILAFRPNQKQ